MPHDYKYDNRRFVIGALVVVVILLYILRLFNLQILEDKYKIMANDNAFQTQTIYPSRGIIYDRQGRELVYNQSAHDLLVTVKTLKGEGMDTLDFCKTLGITREVFDKRMKDIKNFGKNPGYSQFSPQVFSTQLMGDTYARLQESLYRYPAFELRSRTIRQYKYQAAALLLGSVREANKKEVEGQPDVYQRGDLVGDFGVEKSYEEYLRGKKGKTINLRDARGRIKGKFEDGRFDEEPVAGHDLTLSIDIELQQYAESLFVNKIGALVAIEPSTGEVLALVTSPSFDPRLLVGHDRARHYSELMADPYKPLINRAISSPQPPGSTFKPTQGLIGLQDGAITASTPLHCNHGFRYGNFKMGCHDGSATWTLIPAIATSCNGYFGWCLFNVLNNRKKYKSVPEAFDHWKEYMVSMGYGYKLGIDLPGEVRGFIPNRAYYTRNFKTENWNAINIISISIGQGEILATPLQIANLASTIANRGYYYIPHVVHSISGYEQIPDTFLHRHYTMIDSANYALVVEGMRMAATNGTVHSAGNMDPEGIELCGKTGTAQNPHGKDHSVFMGFAPKDNPRIAVCCYVENAGFGATFGVPIGTLVIEKYLNGKISARRKFLEERMMNSSTMMYMDEYLK